MVISPFLRKFYICLIVGLLAIFVGLFGNQYNNRFSNVFDPWLYSDVLAIDMVDADNPVQDILAIYARESNDLFQVRIDFLELDAVSQEQDIYLVIDSMPGGSKALPFNAQSKIEWDFLIIIPATGKSRMITATDYSPTDFHLNIWRNTTQSSIVVTFEKSEILLYRDTSSITAYSVSTKFGRVEDQIIQSNLAQSFAPPPVEIGFIFHNVFQAITPMQVLRGWDGAHSGPDSSRHGAKHLFNAVKQYRYPVSLDTNLLIDEYVSPLKWIGAKDLVQGLYSDLLLSSCGDYCVDNVYNGYTQFSSAKFTELMIAQATQSGQVLNIYIDFPASKWGNPNYANQLFSYIAAHPWIRVVNTSFATHANLKQSECSQYYQETGIDAQIRALRPNLATNHAERIFEQVSSSILDTRSPLCEIYKAQLGHLITASKWLQSPQSDTNCSRDIDWDGTTECIISTMNILIIIENDGAYITNAFLRTRQNAFQIIAPTFQYTVGKNELANQIPGAFYLTPSPQITYDVRIEEQYIEYLARDASIRKSYRVETDRIQFTMRSNEPYILQIPLTPIDPDRNYPVCSQFTWESLRTADPAELIIDSDVRMLLKNYDGTMTIQSVCDAYNLFQLPEDPNLPYSAGYFLPIPFTIAETNARALSSQRVELIFLP